MAFFCPGRACFSPLHTLQELCLFKICDNLDMLGDVGDTPSIFLEKILAHCTLEQLRRIEDASKVELRPHDKVHLQVTLKPKDLVRKKGFAYDCIHYKSLSFTKGRDLESITNEFWHSFYQKKCGADVTRTLAERVRKKGLPLRWRALYEHKVKQEEQTQAKCVSRLRELFLKEKNEKQMRTVQVCARRPEASRNKRPAGPPGPASVQRGRLLVKAKKEFAGSFDAQRRKSMLHRQPSSVHSPLGKRTVPASLPSPGPISKRPALGSPPAQVRLQLTERLAKPDERVSAVGTLGKRPAEPSLNGGPVQKRLALENGERLGTPQTKQGVVGAREASGRPSGSGLANGRQFGGSENTDLRSGEGSRKATGGGGKEWSSHTSALGNGRRGDADVSRERSRDESGVGIGKHALGRVGSVKQVPPGMKGKVKHAYLQSDNREHQKLSHGNLEDDELLWDDVV